MPNKDPFELQEDAFSSAPVDSTIATDNPFNLNEDKLDNYFQSKAIQKQLDKDQELLDLESKIPSNYPVPGIPFLTIGDAVRYGEDVGSGAVGTVAGLVGFAEYISLQKGNVEGAHQLKGWGESLRKTSANLMAKDPTFTDQVFSGFGSMATFLVPGAGVGMSSAMLGTKLAATLGLGTMTVLEAATEAGQTWQETKDPLATNKVFAANVVLLALTNRFGLGSQAKTLLKRTLASASMEGLQEGVQEIIQSVGRNEEPNWKNVIESAGVGAIIGGGAHVFFGSEQEQKNNLKITKKQWNNYIEATRNRDARTLIPEQIKETQSGMAAMQNFGHRLNTQDTPFEVSADEHQVALNKVNELLPNSINRVDNIMTGMVMDKHIMPNILDGITLLGRENFTNYLASLEEQNTEFNFTKEFVQSHPAYQLSNSTMHNITQAEMIKIMNRVTKADPNILNNLAATQAGLNEDQTKLFEQDLVAGVALNFDDMGWSLLERKWKGIVTEEQLKPILDRAKAIDNTKFKPIGERALSDALQQFSGDIQAEINERAAIVAEETITQANESKRVIDDAISNPEANIINEGGLNSHAFDEEKHFYFAWDVYGGTPMGNSLTLKEAQANISHIFTDPSYDTIITVDRPDRIEYWEANAWRIYNANPDTLPYGKEAPPLTSAQRERLLEIDKQLVAWEDSLSNEIGVPASEAQLAVRRALVQERNNVLKFGVEPVAVIYKPSAQFMRGRSQGDYVYGTQLYDFKGSTFKDLWSFLKAKGIAENNILQELTDKIAPSIKDIEVVRVDTLPDTVAGRFADNKILINSTFRAVYSNTIVKTATHEGLHAYTSKWMDTTEDGKAFTRQLQLAINTMQEVFANPKRAVDQGLFMGSVEEIEDWRQVAQKVISEKETNISYISNPKELLANIMTNTTEMAGFLSKISAVSTPQQGGIKQESMWKSIWTKLQNLWKSLVGDNEKQGNLVGAINELFFQYEPSIQAFHKQRQYTPKAIRDLRAASMETITTGLTQESESNGNYDKDDTENFNDKSEDDNLEYQYITNFVELAGAIDGADASAFRDRIKQSPTINHFISLINELDTQSLGQLDNRIKEIYEAGDFRDKLNPTDELSTLEVFKLRFLTGLFNFIKSSKVAPFITFKTEYHGKTHNFSIVEQPFLFQMGDGTTKSSYVRPIVLEDFIPELTKVFGLAENDLQLVYTAGFETWYNGEFRSRRSIDGVVPYNIGLDKTNEQTMTQDLANKIFMAGVGTNKTYIYLGNFGGNNTLPLLAIPKAKAGQVLLKAKQLLRSIGDTSQYGDGGQLAMAFRLVLEDSWYGTPVTEQGFAEDSYIKNNDLNATWKRGKKFIVEKRNIANDNESIKRVLGNKSFVGTKVSGGEFADIQFRAAAFDSTDDGAIMVDGEQVLIQPLLTNTYGTETTDGVTYYLIGEFDYLYNNLHGTVKDGVLKNVISTPGFYVKHSMQGVHKNSALGQWMVRHNLALLISDTSRKIPKAVNENVVRLSEGAPSEEKIININIKNISRISESLYTDTNGATVKQVFNSSGLTKGNPLLQNTSTYDEYFKAVTNMVNNSTRIALEKVNELATPNGLYKILKSIVNNPQSPRERAISKTLQKLMNLNEDEFLSAYGGIINHPTIAKQIRQRLFRPIDSALQGKVAGARAVLEPSIGKLNKQACVDPVTNARNSELLLMSLPSSSPISRAAFPERGLVDEVKRYLELQRQESRMLNKGMQNKQGYQIVVNGEIKEVNQREYIQWSKDEIKRQIKEKSLHTQDEARAKALMSGDIYKAINKQDKKVKEWLENVQAGKSNIFNDDSQLTEDWVIVSRDIAERFGLKPGDKLIAVVTPTDSPLGIIAVKIAGIANSYGQNRVIDRSATIFNSEYIQSIVGKDYDIDTISLMPFDPDYWNQGDFETVWQTIYELKGEYKSWLADMASLTLGRKVTKDEVFNKNVLPVFYEKFIVQHAGTEDIGRLAGVTKFNPADHFFAIDRNYLQDPNKAIVRRQFHTMLSAIDLRSSYIDLNKEPARWLQAHLIHLIDTNFSVDFPNKTSRLKYNPPSSDHFQTRLAAIEWGMDMIEEYPEEGHVRDYKDVPVTASQVKQIHSFFRWIFGDAFNIARGSNALTGEKLDYHTLRDMIRKQQAILTTLTYPLSAGTEDPSVEHARNIKALIGAYAREQKLSPRLIQFLEKTLGGMYVSNIMDYPLFQMIMSINPDLLPMPGASYQDWMTDQAQATTEVVETSTYLSKLMAKMRKDTKKMEALEIDKYLPITQTAILLDNMLLEMDFGKFRKDQPNSLNAIRNEVITAIQAYDEIREPDKTKMKDAELQQFRRNQKARAAMYPLLFNELLKLRRIQWRNAIELVLDHNGSKYHIARTRDGQIALKRGGGQWYRQQSVLEGADDNARALRDVFTKPGGVWENANNRLLLTNIGLANNLSVDARINFLKPYIAQKVYNGNFDTVEAQALWLSFISQVANDGLKDNRAQGLVLAKYEFDPMKPMDFQGNDVAFELFAHFEPATYAQWVSTYSFLNQETNRQTKEMGIRRLAEDQNGAGEVLNSIRFDETDGPGSVRLAFRMLADEIKSYQSELSDREFAKAVKTKGYGAGLKIIKGMIQNEAILEGLAASDIFFGELLHDIKNLSATAFEKKYDEGQIETINAVASMRLQGQEFEKNFLTEQFGTEKYDNIENIPKLLQIYSVLKAAQKTKVKADKMLSPLMRKMGINYMSYKFIGPYRENKIYAAEKSTTLIDHKFTKDGDRDMSLGDVDIHMRPYSTRTYQTHGESSVAIAKNQEMNAALNLIQAELSSLIKNSDETTDLIINANSRADYLKESPVLTDTVEAAWIRKHLVEMRDLPKEEIWEARRRVFETAENMEKNLKIRVLGNNGKVTGYMDLVSGSYIANTPSYNAKYDFIDQLFKNYPAQRKLEVMAALTMRELYDIQIPHLLDKALGYLQKSREFIGIYGNYDSVLEVQALIDRYTQYVDAIKARIYNYMPHMYPIELYKTWWYSEYKALIEQKLAAQIKRAQILLRQGDSRADVELASIDTKTPEGQKIFKAKVESYLKFEWEQFRVGNPTSYVIPNFLVRRVKESEDLEYIKGTTDMHYNYVNNLITGLRNDLMYSDWLVYLSKARRSGERSYLIEATKLWYADQIQHRMLHTKPIETAKLERGMQVNFTFDAYTMDRDEFYPRKAGIQIWGIVDKVDLKEGKLYLKSDKDKIKYEAEQDIMKTDSILRNMSVNDQLAPATLKQVMMIRNQLQRGYLQSSDLAKPLEELTVHQAAQLIIKGNQWVLDNLDKIGVFDLNQIYTRNLRGQVDRKNVNRYMRRGAVERLDGWAREVRNLRGDDGTFDNTLDAIHYGMLKGSAWTATHALSAIKNTQAMAFLGAVVAPKAFVINALGAMSSNILDAPVTNAKFSQEARREWGTIKHTNPSKMTKEQREWYTIMVSLGLASNKDLVAISLQAGNIDPISVLSQQGAWDSIRYLAKGIIEGAPYQAYLKRMDELRTELIKSDFDDDIYMKILEEEKLWRAKVNGLVKKKLKNLTQGERDTAIKAQQALEKSGKKEKRSFAQEVNLTQIQALKLAAGLVKNSTLRGWIGLGLQAKAEVLRRPGFYIGYQTAISLGFNKEQAIQMGINSIEARHAFYSAGYKQFGANTKAGALMQQFSQYSWNQFVIQFRMWREAVPQTMEHWTRSKMSGRNLFQAFWDTVLRRTTPMLDAYGKQVINRQGKEVGELNIAHYLMMRYALGFMLMQAGTRAFYGMTNWQDPMVQLFYKLGDMLTDIPKGDFDPEELGSMLWFLSDTLFFLGVPYKLAAQFIMRDPNQDVRETVQRGRVEDQIDFAYRVNNEIAVLRNPYLRLHKDYKRNLEQVDYWFDDVLAGVKFFGYSAPDKSGQPYMRWGFYPGLSDEWPFIEIEKGKRMITPPNTLRYYDTNKQGIGGKGKEFQRFFELGLSPLTWIPYGDKLIYPNKKDRR